MSASGHAIVNAPLSAEELAALPDDDHRYDLVRGELRRMVPAGFRHGAIAARIARRLDEYVDAHGLGVVVGAETGFRLEREPDTVLGPDAAFVAGERLPPEDQRDGFLDLAPDLVVEIVSPSDRASEVNEKALTYVDAGVRLVWVVYPTPRLVTVYESGGVGHLVRAGDELDGGDVLPGFRLPVAELFG